MLGPAHPIVCVLFASLNALRGMVTMIVAFIVAYLIPTMLSYLPSTKEIWVSIYRADPTSRIITYKVIKRSLSSVAQSSVKVGASATSQPGDGRDVSPTSSNEKAAATSRMNSDKELVERSSEEENTKEDRNANEDDHEETEEEKEEARKKAEYVALLNRSSAGRQTDISDPFKVPEGHLHILRDCEKMPGDVDVGDFGCVAMSRIDKSVPGRERRKACESLESCARFVLPSEVDEDLLIHAEPSARRKAARKRRESGGEGQASLGWASVGERASSVSGGAREERQKDTGSKGDENEGAVELKPRSIGRSAAVADSNEGRLKAKGPYTRMVVKGPYHGADGWRIQILAHAIHYLNNSPTTTWPAEKAYFLHKALGFHVEFHKLRGRKDQAEARSSLVQARRAEAAEAQVAVVQREVAELREVAESAREEAKVAQADAKSVVVAAQREAEAAAEQKINTVLKEVMARSERCEREMQSLKHQLEETKAALLCTGGGKALVSGTGKGD